MIRLLLKHIGLNLLGELTIQGYRYIVKRIKKKPSNNENTEEENADKKSKETGSKS